MTPPPDEPGPAAGGAPEVRRDGGDDEPVARTIVVRGRVQGVGFRASCRHRATALGVAGWARNLPDGSVQVWAVGPAAAVDHLVTWCAQGPPLAHVTDVQVADGPAPTGAVTGFAVR